MEISQFGLMQLHISTMFVLDAASNLCTVNEPWDKTKLACKFFFGRTMEGQFISRFRSDVSAITKNKINELCRAEPTINDNYKKPTYLNEYLRLLNSGKYTVSLCFYVPHISDNKNKCTSINVKNALALTSNGFSWLVDEVEFAQPCVGVVLSGQIISICRSVRITHKAHEAGIETLEGFRGNGFAFDVLAAWSEVVRAKGAIPLYSTELENKASQRVAEKALLYNYGIGFSVM